jgi:hypothetical protein
MALTNMLVGVQSSLKPNMSSTASSTVNDYQYKPLNHTTQQIRLVTLLDPLESDDAIRLDVNIFNLPEAPVYTALSYVWGPPTSKIDIYMENGRLGIRDNLFKFLTEFRKLSDKMPSDRYLWIDQLCIDQSTTSERNHQVRMMSDIYSKAGSVIVWLGDGSEKVDVWMGDGESESESFETEYDAARAWANDGKPAALAYVLHSGYFERLWIVQEFVLARVIRILVRDIWLLNGTLVLTDNDAGRNIPFPARSVIRESSLLRQGRHTHLDIRVALQNYSSNGCVDPRDRIYGLLGIVFPEQRVVVDYGRSFQQLCMDITLVVSRSYCLSRTQKAGASVDHQTFTLLRLAGHMKITQPQRTSFIVFMSAIFHSQRLGRFEGRECPITAMGFDEAMEKWWFEFQDTRQFVDCIDEAPATKLAKTPLLSDDWQRYVPYQPRSLTM